VYRFQCKRKLRAQGKAAYLAVPKLARLELGLFIGDEVLIELDTKRKLIVIRAATPRAVKPFADLNQLEMLPGRPASAPAPAEAEPIAPAPIAEKVPA
jgi:hypothetical protein